MYDYPLYRPPSEGNSLIIQVTLGCSHNKCTFCGMYKNKQFKIKSLEEIKKDIDFFRSEYSYVEKIFLADGDALIIKYSILEEILNYINKVFPECKRITLYGSPKSILIKSEEELKKLKKLGLYMIYMGVETGDERVLKDINKGVTTKEIIEAVNKVKLAGILVSATFILGIGGKTKTKEHAINTGKLISLIAPDYVGLLSLMVEDNTALYKSIVENKFTLLKDMEVLEELKLLIENICTNEEIIFRCNHGSNYIMLKGILPYDKERLIKEVEFSMKNSLLRNEYERRL